MTAKTSDWQPGPTVCRCCFAEGCYKDISTEYFWMGKREVYSEMLMDTFDLSISYALSGPNSNSRLICEPCISRLRDATDFKRQVLECERMFMQHLNPVQIRSGPSASAPADQEKEAVKLELIKTEKKLDEDDDDGFDDRAGFLDDDDDDLDDQPLTAFATKVPKKETMDLSDLLDNSKVEKRKAVVKLKTVPAKKQKRIEVAKPKKPEAPKPSVSKPKAQPEKKRGVTAAMIAKRNAEAIVKYTTVYPFRLRGKLLVCVYCLDKFEQPTDLRRHLDEEHKTIRIDLAFYHCGNGHLKVDCTHLKCRLCSEPFDTIDNVAKHLKQDHNVRVINFDYNFRLTPYRLNERLTCYVCNQKQASLFRLVRHTTCHFQKFTCDSCGKTYLNKEGLQYHIRCSHKTYEGVPCRRCWSVFPTTEMKNDHVRTSDACKPFGCVSCGARFLSWEMKQKHRLEIHGESSRAILYDCQDCGISFDNRRTFSKHYKLEHTDEGAVCSCCGMRFESKRYLEDHLVTHTGEKKYICGVCQKNFTTKKSLKQHMWIHSDKKRFVCSVCQKQFAQKVSWKGHMKSNHPEIEIPI